MTPYLTSLAQAQQQPGLESWFFLLAPLLLIWYFVLFRPQNKQQEEKQKLLAALQKGDRVIFAGGIHGKIHEVQKDTFVIEIADKVRVKINREAVQGLPSPGSANKGEENKAD